jgi:hypothetical protein
VDMTHSKNIIIGLIILVIIGLGVFYYIKERKDIDGEQIVCTMDAKMCPDGSYVSRSGPKCEFDACPTASVTDSWETKVDAASKVEFKYPKSIEKEYITATDWPPVARIASEKFSCLEAGLETGRAGITGLFVVNGNSYCVTKVSEGAAGSTYTQYAYARDVLGKNVILTFTLRFPQCANYNDPKKTECETERTAFNLNGLVDQIFGTMKLI